MRTLNIKIAKVARQRKRFGRGVRRTVYVITYSNGMREMYVPDFSSFSQKLMAAFLREKLS